MSVPLSNTELDHLLAFVGYGSLDTDVWFLGMEEAGGGEDIIGYGKAFWPDYREIFTDMTFRTSDQFEVASRDQLLVILTAHFTARAMNGKLDALVNMIRQHPSLDSNS